LYVREQPGIYERHLQHAKLLGLPISNVLRKPKKIEIKSFLELVRLLKKSGVRNLVNCILRNGEMVNRATGLHFVITKPYYEKVNKIRQKYEEIICNTSLFKKHFDPEEVLYHILDECGWAALMPQAESSEEMFDSSEGNTKYRPHHGVHLGIFRVNKFKIPRGYEKYLQKIRPYFSDPLYIEISQYFSRKIKREIGRLEKFCEEKIWKI
jgi:hypothetical protein